MVSKQAIRLKYYDKIDELNTEILKAEQRDEDRAQSGLWGYSTDSRYSTEALKEKRQIYLDFLTDLDNL